MVGNGLMEVMEEQVEYMVGEIGHSSHPPAFIGL